LQASVRGLPATPERASFVLERARLARRAAAGETLASADRAEFHVRRNQQSAAAAPVFDLASRLTNASLPVWRVLAERPLNAEANGVLRGIDDLVPKPAAQRLREWQAAGGKLELTKARVQQGDALGLATGEIGLTAEGRLQGGFDLTLAGFDQVTRGLLGSQTQSSGQLGLLAGLAMLGSRTEVEGKRAVSIPLRLERGALLLGPLRIAQTGAQF
jgi:hypothetical protein